MGQSAPPVSERVLLRAAYVRPLVSTRLPQHKRLHRSTRFERGAPPRRLVGSATARRGPQQPPEACCAEPSPELHRGLRRGSLASPGRNSERPDRSLSRGSSNPAAASLHGPSVEWHGGEAGVRHRSPERHTFRRAVTYSSLATVPFYRWSMK